eukprot:1012039-Rhodomonas_salina.1
MWLGHVSGSGHGHLEAARHELPDGADRAGPELARALICLAIAFLLCRETTRLSVPSYGRIKGEGSRRRGGGGGVRRT